MKLAKQTRAGFGGRTHFLALSAEAMRRVLVDHARGRKQKKRGGGCGRVTITSSEGSRAQRCWAGGRGPWIDGLCGSSTGCGESAGPRG